MQPLSNIANFVKPEHSKKMFFQKFKKEVVQNFNYYNFNIGWPIFFWKHFRFFFRWANQLPATYHMKQKNEIFSKKDGSTNMKIVKKDGFFPYNKSPTNFPSQKKKKKAHYF